MHRINCKDLLLVSACMLIGAMAWGQKSPSSATQEPISINLGATYDLERAQTVPGNCCFWMQGGGVDMGVTFWKGFGIAAAFNGGHASNIASGIDANKIAYLGGPRYTYTVRTGHSGAETMSRYQIFGQGLVGGVHGFDSLYPAGTATTQSANAFALETGGGINYYFTKNWGLRLIEADYVYMHLPNMADNTQNDLRLAFGVTYRRNLLPAPPVSVACSATPASVFPGDPVSLTASAENLNPKLRAIYGWSGNGVSGDGTTSTVATGALAPGNYAAKCSVKEGRHGKEGLKAGQYAEAEARFTVKPFEPPTLTCSANPSAIKPGESVTITATGISPQNRPLTYSYSFSAGAVKGSGSSVIFSSTGAPTGATTITCSIADDKGQTASSSTNVMIAAPYVAPAPHTQALCTIGFEKDKKRPTRVDNEAKACLDEVALSLQKQSDAKAVIVGSATTNEMNLAKGHKKAKVVNFAAERAVNAKDYLVKEKGIDAARISATTDNTNSSKVADYLVPSGASFAADVPGTTPVDEWTVKPQARKPMTEIRHRVKSLQPAK